MRWHHWIMLIVILAVGYVLGIKFPNALSSVPVIGPAL